MDLVIDANILFALLITKSKTEDIIFHEDVHIFAPEFLFVEFEKYNSLILDKTSRPKKCSFRTLLVLTGRKKRHF